MGNERAEPEVDVYAAAIKLAVAELGEMCAEVVAWRRAQFESVVKVAAMTW